MSEHPPGPFGGAPLIARQHLRRYDQSLLHVLCDRRLYRAARESGPDALLNCDHTSIAHLEPGLLRPRRVFSPMFDAVNALRVPLIKRAARRIIERRRIEAIFTAPWRTEFAASAFQVSRETGVPLYVFETDDWHAMNQGPLVSMLTRRWHPELIRQASHLWVTSPMMARAYRDRFGVEGEFLFHFVDPEAYQRAEPRDPREPSEFRLVYTGAVNTMFLATLERIAEWLNAGLMIDDGRRVVLDLWGSWCPQSLIGPGFRWRGFVPSHEVPGILAGADALLVAITFAETPALQELIRSSLYTKTVDYLASGQPVVVVSPADTAEVDYFGAVTWLVDSLNRDCFIDALRQTALPEAGARSQAGLELVQRSHTAETMGERFLSAFRTESSSTAQSEAVGSRPA